VLLLVAAALLLLTPCVAAARFALSFDTNRQSPSIEAPGQRKREAWNRTPEEQQVVELEAQAIKLKQRLEQTPQSKQDERAAIEAEIKGIERSLLDKAFETSQLSGRAADVQKLERMLDEYQSKRPADEAKVKEMEQLLAQAKTQSPGDLELTRQMMENIAAEQAASQGDRKPRLLSHTEARYTDDARAKGIEGKVVLGFNIDQNGIPQDIQVKQSLYPSLDQAAIEAVRSWKFEPAMKNGQVVSKWIEVQINFNLYQDPQKKEEQETRERREKELVLKAWQIDGQDGQEIKVRLGDEAGRRAERESQQKRDAILAGLAKISMDHAIQIATSKVPGKVTECTLVGERWEDPGELAKPSLVLYHVVVLSDEATPVKTHVLINAMDGSIFRVSKEEQREEEETRYLVPTRSDVTKKLHTIEGGVLNVKASSLPAPQYPAIAREAHASGSVNVRVLIDGDGNVVEAAATSGHPLLRAAAQAAAKEAKFAPTRLSGEPVAVTGVLVYNFVAQ
jgi:TonB family protein